MIIGKVNFSSFSDTFSDLLGGILKYEATFRDWITNNIPDGMLSEKMTDVANAIMSWIGDNVSASSIITFFTNIGGSIFDILVGIIISIYLMKDKQFFKDYGENFFTLYFRKKVMLYLPKH